MQGLVFDQVAYVLRGDADAIAFFMSILSVCHFWDDLIDKDVEISDEAINSVMWVALIDIPANPFYQQHREALRMVLGSRQR